MVRETFKLTPPAPGDGSRHRPGVGSIQRSVLLGEPLPECSVVSAGRLDTAADRRRSGRNLKIRFYGKRCKWWHFFPKEKYANLKSKFDEIMQGKTENPIVNSLLKSAKSFKEKLPESSILKNLI